MDATVSKNRVLVGNVFFSPTSFGGATVIAENMAIELKNNYGWDVIVVTTIDDPALPTYCVRRYSTYGIDIIGIKVPEFHFDKVGSWHNEQFNRVFGHVLDLVKPDIAHIHCIQNMGATCLQEIKSRRIPLVTTVHDCWWICERQFMINSMGHYCHQEKIDLNICRHCVADITMTRRRFRTLTNVLQESDLLLFPSKFHRDLHVANGIPSDKCIVNKNGVKPPSPDFFKKRKVEGEFIRFGFVGGPGPIKGSILINKALNEIELTNYELKVVDAGQTRSETWANDPTWDVPGKVSFIPPYTQENMDDFFSEIDVLLFPSQWKESFGLTVREAMIRGVWTIVTDAGGLTEDCIDGQNSTVIPLSQDHSYLREAIENILENGLNEVKEVSHISVISDQAKQLNSILSKAFTNQVESVNYIEDLECL
ncbi:glycosyltransferase family 4 protein [Microbulbifer bruguierae]|uniref:Glycosyltransferase family 4 protein n=1 Tax=Microbulbifer bruguierae TaxID=3029061 RepID=A0ABY8NFZ6_9GAMM|nr:glycosyltransferase family 4 protein [Microbulbifer bruguierae]WGL17289.1 glycosyltransferase family 4 protein [Microbulbifer bruguierae]